jgi:hypothetical protein
MDIIDSFDKPWTTLMEHFNSLVKKAIASYGQMEPLILYFESQAISAPNIHSMLMTD